MDNSRLSSVRQGRKTFIIRSSDPGGERPVIFEKPLFAFVQTFPSFSFRADCIVSSSYPAKQGRDIGHRAHLFHVFERQSKLFYVRRSVAADNVFGIIEFSRVLRYYRGKTDHGKHGQRGNNVNRHISHLSARLLTDN